MSLIAAFIVALLPMAISAQLKTFYLSELCRSSSGESVDLLLGAVTESFNSAAMIQDSPRKEGYSYNSVCNLEISAPPGHHIVASVQRLQLRRNCVDNLTIYFDDKKHTFCGLHYDEYENPSLTAQGPMVIEFTSGSFSQEFIHDTAGFQLTVTAYRDSPCNSTTDFTCENNRCIAGELNCSRHNHCGDNSNQQCPTVPDAPRNCSFRQFVCANGNCVDVLDLCNGHDQCGDLSDELACDKCSGSDFSCRNGNCIFQLEVCNRVNNCGDWSDEEHCSYTCLFWQFTCQNGHCIDPSSVCDGKNDCGDWSDEKSCTSTAKRWDLATYWPLLLVINVAAVLYAIIVYIFLSSRSRSRAELRQLLPGYETHLPHQEEFINPLCTPTENAVNPTK